jgi:hypothetical protein
MEMEMSKKKVTFKPLTRQDLASPFHSYSHPELLRLAGIETFGLKLKIKKLPHGKIAICKPEKKGSGDRDT